MMDRILNNKWSIRILSLVLAAILFTSVTSENNAGDGSFQTASQMDTETIQNVPVEVYYDKENLYVSGVPDTVTVTLSGPRSIVQNARAQQDFKVYADLRNAKIGEQTVEFQVKDISERLKVTISPESAKVNVQEKVTKKFSVEAEIGNSVIADGYEAGTPKVDPGKVSITGAKDTIEQIAYVKANVETSSAHKEDFTAKATVSAFDNNLNKLDVEISPEKVDVSVPVEKVGKSVPLKINQTGTPSEDITISSITPETKEVVVEGDADVLAKIDEISVNVNVSNITADTVQEVTIPVPNGAKSVQPQTVEVRIKTVKKSNDDSNANQNEPDSNDDNPNSDDGTDGDQTVSKTFQSLDVFTRGLPSTYTAQMITPTNGKVNVTLSGPRSTINQISASSITAVADLSNAKEGEYSTRIQVNNLPNKVSYKLSVSTADFLIKLKETAAVS
ncbi:MULTISPECIES: YbbR-like domain-containing protein [Listeria]|uniref:CdaR family protein n=1 Tax=Listeria TaxID=1637 RepID=UPI000B591CC8|nr:MULTISPECIES: CdaR family protein [Listeria]